MIREFDSKDIEAIDKIFQKQPWLSVPGLKNLIINATLENNKGDVIGYGALKQFAELVLILDQSRPKRERARALLESMQTAILKAKDSDLEYIYAVASDQNFADVLRNHYGFRVVPGELLVLDLNTSED